MAFVTDKEELRPGLIIFRRADVQHHNWYCRVKLPKADRYKTVSLKTNDINAARLQALEHEGEVRYATKRGDPVFNRPFREVAKEYLAAQIARAKRGEISKSRPEKVRTILDGPLNEYVGSTQVSRIGDELWAGYMTWRRENGEGRAERNGSRMVSRELAEKLVRHDQSNFIKTQVARGYRAPTFSQQQFEDAVTAKLATPVSLISDATIRFEMAIFGAVMQFAIKKRYAPVSQRFDDRPKLKVMRRDEFTAEEYRHLYEYARDTWVKAATTELSKWYRNVAYNFVLIMCNTGMRPSEAKNLRWRDVTMAKDRDGQEMTVLFVQGKGKSRKLGAQRPDNAYGKGPDNLWAFTDSKYFVIECKNGATSDQGISKHDLGQLGQGMEWFAEKYTDAVHATPIIIHPLKKPGPGAAAIDGARVMTEDQLSKLRIALTEFAKALGDENVLNDTTRIAKLLTTYHFTRSDFLNHYTVPLKP